MLLCVLFKKLLSGLRPWRYSVILPPRSFVLIFAFNNLIYRSFGIGFCLWGRCSVWYYICSVRQSLCPELWNHRCVWSVSHSLYHFMGSICLFQQFSTRVILPPPGTSCSFWRHFLLSRVCVCVCVYYWHLTTRSQGFCRTSHITQDSSIMKNHPSPMPAVPRWWDLGHPT